MPEPHFTGLRAYVDNAARQPDFDAVRQRAGRVRRRRAVVSSAAAAVAALLVTGLGYAATAGPQVALPKPSASATPDSGWPRVTGVQATGAADLYVLYERCRDCGSELYASDDAGATWQRRSVPPTAGGTLISTFASLGRGVLVWRDGQLVNLQDLPGSSPTGSAVAEPSGTLGREWTTVDGGRSWRQAVVDTKPVAAVPAGTRPVDCHVVGQTSPCRIYAVDPVTGRFAPLATQPSGITVSRNWAGQTDVPLGGRLWVAGLDPATRKPAVASSSDGGRTWHTFVFSGGVPAKPSKLGIIAGMYLPTVAAGPGGTAYALLYHDDHGREAYRTTDGGVTWRPVPGGPVADTPDSGFVTSAGAHVVKSGDGFRISRGGGRYQPVTLAGYPADLLPLPQLTSQQAPGRYVVFADARLYLSDDGQTWRRVTVP